jgi:hypothetical protein
VPEDIVTQLRETLFPIPASGNRKRSPTTILDPEAKRFKVEPRDDQLHDRLRTFREKRRLRKETELSRDKLRVSYLLISQVQ